LSFVLIYLDAFWKQSFDTQNATSVKVEQALKQARATLSTPASLIYYLAEAPYLATDNVQDLASDRSSLQEQNVQMQKLLALQSLQVQRYTALKSENDRLRELLGSRKKLPGNAVIAEIIGSVPNAYTHQVIIDKGSADGIVDGLGVVDAQGLFGQVVSVGSYSSRVLLLIDRDHAVPARINRTGTRLIAGGTGEEETLLLENVSISTDIVIGDLIETSGFGGRFPDGYPLGVVRAVSNGSGLTYAQVEVRPSAQLNSTGHVLVIMPELEGNSASVESGVKSTSTQAFAQ
jgi:rod shape-determining protein MreC